MEECCTVCMGKVHIFVKCVRHGVIDLEDVNIKFKVLIILFERSKCGLNSNSMSIHKRLILKLLGSSHQISFFARHQKIHPLTHSDYLRRLWFGLRTSMCAAARRINASFPFRPGSALARKAQEIG